MRISILGGGGFLGRKVAAALAAGRAPVTALTLCDIAAPPAPAAAFPVETVAGDVADPAAMARAVPDGTDAVIHLAAVVSAAAEADWGLGMRVNIDGTRALIERCRALARPPRVVFTSSVATFNGGQDAVLADDARQVPTGSYGMQKAAAELMLQDASRRGFLDAVNIRLPTIMVRPGRPNRAASSFVSAIVREPLLGLATDLPVDPGYAVWAASPRAATDWLLHAATMDTTRMGLDRGVNPPGLRVSMADALAALDRARPGAAALVRHAPDAEVQRIVAEWPAAFAPMRARRLGFRDHESLDELIAAFIADDLATTQAERGM
jgi:nucleoside-diphosphate-sugar epimerase